VWSDGDHLVTRAPFESMCDALGEPFAITVRGGPSWLIADPERFAGVVRGMLPILQPEPVEPEPPAAEIA